MAITVIPGTLLYLNDQIFLYIIGVLLSMLVSFGLTYTVGYHDEMLKKGK
ncbi:hypothetical protein [Bacillus coahuilensis]|nr:hypothetical protein [Bacillus coahuilensis]